MKINQFLFYYNTQILYDLFLKFNFLNVHELPKIKKVNLYILNPKAKKKLILIYIIKLLLLVNQFSYLSIIKNKNNKYKIENIFINLNKINQFIFLNKFINVFLPLVKNLKKFKTSFFKNGNFIYKFHDINILNNSTTFKLNNFKQTLNLNIITTTKNNLIGQIFFNLLFFPVTK